MEPATPAKLPETVTLRPASGKVLTVVIGLFAAVGLFSFIFRGIPRDAVQFSLLAVGVVYLCWLLFWFPSVTVEPSGVTVRNVARTFRVSWPVIVRIETRYALTLITKGGEKIVAWSAPSPSRYAGINTVRPDLRGLTPVDRMRNGRVPLGSDGKTATVPLGDALNSESGITALHVRRAWAALRDAGYLDSGAIEGSGIVTSWNTRALLAGAALVLLGLLAAFLI